MIHVEQGKMSESTAHVFVYILTEDGIMMGHVPDAMRQKADEIINAVAAAKRPGRLWVSPFQMNWPQGMNPTPNGQPSRNVWGVLIPQQKEKYSHELMLSLELLASWIKATNLPLRIAVYDDGRFYKHGDRLMAGNEYQNKLQHFLGEWDVAIYHQ